MNKRNSVKQNVPVLYVPRSPSSGQFDRMFVVNNSIFTLTLFDTAIMKELVVKLVHIGQPRQIYQQMLVVRHVTFAVTQSFPHVHTFQDKTIE